jgi:hypothetical protein
MKQSVVLTAREVNQILVDYVVNKYKLKGKVYDVDWDFYSTPITVRITEEK